jgi:hypothetical protein
MKLDREDIEMIADSVARRLRDELTELAEHDGDSPAAQRLVDAAAVARTLGVDRDWVYAHAKQLGAVRLGGPHGRLRFDLDRLPKPGAMPPPAAARRPRRKSAKRLPGSDPRPVPGTRRVVESSHTAKRPAGARTPPARPGG